MRNRIAMLGLVMLLAPQAARADYLDVIVTRLGDCSLEKYMTAVDEFRAVIKKQDYPYTLEIAVPLINNDMDVVYWIGRSTDLAAFATAYTRWEVEIAKPGTPEAKVNEKLDACGENVSRSGQVTR